MGGAQSGHIIEPVIGRSGEAGGAVVHIEQDRVESRARLPDQLGDIGFAQPHARIAQAVAEQLRHRTACPGRNGRHQLGHGDLRLGAQRRERSAQREAHAEPADQQMRLRARANARAGHAGERRLGAADPAVHQLVLPKPDRELGAAPHEAQLAAAPHLRGIDQRPGDHGPSCSGRSAISTTARSATVMQAASA
jgi:hypothetical protein